eukprot:Phypoly_transcript_10123.p1 GENE.Phypoly_transcript_10123~~Phypoly_transcript_10123.p1  ORF type:complete len:429 (+),score=57.15 Phypoly_transcript_10123:4-1290(+)
MSGANLAVLNNYARSKSMASLVDIHRNERKAKEAEDVQRAWNHDEDELILLRRKISLLNAQHAVHARDHMEALEAKDREILNLQNEITNLQQTLARERLSRKNAEERIVTMENEVQKLKRLALAYKTKLVKSNLGGSIDFSKQSPHDESLTPRIDMNTPRDNDIPRMELPPTNTNSESGRLVSSLSTGCVPDTQPHLPSLVSSASVNPPRKKSLSDLLSSQQIMDFPYDLNGIPLQTSDSAKSLSSQKSHPLASSLAPHSVSRSGQPPLAQSQRSSHPTPPQVPPPPLPIFNPPDDPSVPKFTIDSVHSLQIPLYKAPSKTSPSLPPPLPPSLPPTLPPSLPPSLPASLPPSLPPQSYPTQSPRNHQVPVTLSRSISNNSFKLSQSSQSFQSSQSYQPSQFPLQPSQSFLQPSPSLPSRTPSLPPNSK